MAKERKLCLKLHKLCKQVATCWPLKQCVLCSLSESGMNTFLTYCIRHVWLFIYMCAFFCMLASRRRSQRSLKLAPRASIKESILRSSSVVTVMWRMPRPLPPSPSGALRMTMRRWMMMGIRSLRPLNPAPHTPVMARRKKNDSNWHVSCPTCYSYR